MGSYDTGESSSFPRSPRNRIRRELGDVTEHRETPGPSTEYDATLKTIVAIGGGLTPDRIVQPIPNDIRDGSVQSVVEYLTKSDIATTSADRAVVEAIQARMEKTDYRLIVNEALNLDNEKIAMPVVQYLRQRTQQGEDGELKFNFADIAIVSHDEGGVAYQKTQKTLERML